MLSLKESICLGLVQQGQKSLRRNGNAVAGFAISLLKERDRIVGLFGSQQMEDVGLPIVHDRQMILRPSFESADSEIEISGRKGNDEIRVRLLLGRNGLAVESRNRRREEDRRIPRLEGGWDVVDDQLIE